MHGEQDEDVDGGSCKQRKRSGPGLVAEGKDSRSGPVPVAERHNFKESGNQQ